MSVTVVGCSTTASLELNNDLYPSKTEVSEKEEVWEQLTEEGTSGSSDSDTESSLHLSGSDTEQSGHDTDCISGLVSSSTSDNEQEAAIAAPKAELPPPPGLQRVMHYPQQRILSPQRRTRKAPLAEVLSSKLLQVSAGRPVKVWVSSDVKSMKVLDPSIPAKKRPAFPEHAGKEKTLDPSLPVKKHIPAWLLKEAFADITGTTKPSSPKPPKMPFRVPQAVQGCDVAPTPR